MNQGVILIFKSYYLRNIFPKARAAIDSDSSDGSEQSKLKNFWKGFTIKMPLRIFVIHGKRSIKISTFTGVWKNLIPTLMNDLEELKTSVEEITADVVETARELQLEVEPKDVAELLQSHDKT